MGSPKNFSPDPSLPFPIFMISAKVERYLLYDINTITWLRKTHNILGVLIGTLPQFPQQNVFLGLPLELQPEEARFLVEDSLAYIVDDFQRHDNEIRTMTPAQKTALIADLHAKGKAAATLSDKKKEISKEKSIQRLQNEYRAPREEAPAPTPESETTTETTTEDSLFNPSPPPTKPPTHPSPPSSLSPNLSPWALTPTTTSLPLPLPHPTQPPLPTVHPPSYALFQHLHAASYFLSPGLRFGCRFLVYPGDPLRFHSHFLAVAVRWDEEIDLLDLIGGGRLGTGVKKGWMVGGVVEEGDREEEEEGDREEAGENEGKVAKRRVRTFCVEWGGM